MSNGNESLRRVSFATFVASLVMALVTPLILLFVLAQGGAGHGTWGLWYFGLLLWFVAWLAMLVSCITGGVAWKRTGRVS